MPNQLYLPSTDLIRSRTRKPWHGPVVKFNLKDEPSRSTSDTHEKQLTIFTGEYGEDNPEFWCQFEQGLTDIFERRPCLTGPVMFGIGTTCLRGRDLQHFTAVKSTIGGTNPARFTAALDTVKRNYFLTDTPRHDQIEYMKTLKKPLTVSWKEYASFVDYIQTTLQFFPRDMDENVTPKSA